MGSAVFKFISTITLLYDQPKNDSFCSKIESVQYNALLVITGPVQGTSQTIRYKELGLVF